MYKQGDFNTGVMLQLSCSLLTHDQNLAQPGLIQKLGQGGFTLLHSIALTDKNIFEDSYQLVRHFPDFPPWEYRIACFNAKPFIKGSNSVLPEQEIQEMFYKLVLYSFQLISILIFKTILFVYILFITWDCLEQLQEVEIRIHNTETHSRHLHFRLKLQKCNDFFQGRHKAIDP